MKKISVLLVSVIAAVFAAFGLSACSNAGASINPEAYSFITIDINPSVEIIALGGSVIEVKAANYDACVLLDGEDFSSLTVEDAAAKIVSLAEQTGYLTYLNNQVKISVISDDAQTAELLKNAAKNGAEKGSEKAEASVETRLQDELTVKKLKEENSDKFAAMTEEKVRLIEAVMEYDKEMTYELGAEMTVKELSAALKNAVKENNEIFTSELRSQYSALYTAEKQAIGREIAAVYGEEYLSEWEKYTALENVYNDIAETLEKSGLTQEDIAAVADLLEITDVALIEKGGVVKPEYVLNYIDKHISKKGSNVPQSAINSVLEILDGYDIVKHALTEEEISAVNEAIGEEVSYTLLSEVAENLAGRKAILENIKNAVELTDEQIERIKTLEESFTGIKENVLAEMQETIAEVREQITAEKRQRVNAD